MCHYDKNEGTPRRAKIKIRGKKKTLEDEIWGKSSSVR